MQALSWAVGPTPSSLSDEEWDAIAAGLEGTDADSGCWATSELRGDDGTAVLRYALMDPLSGVDYYVSIEVEAAPAVEVAAATAVGIMQCYRLTLDA